MKTWFLSECISKLVRDLAIIDDAYKAAQVIRRQRDMAFLNSWNRMDIVVLRKSFASAVIGQGKFGMEILAQKHIIPDPSVLRLLRFY